MHIYGGLRWSNMDFSAEQQRQNVIFPYEIYYFSDWIAKKFTDDIHQNISMLLVPTPGCYCASYGFRMPVA